MCIRDRSDREQSGSTLCWHFDLQEHTLDAKENHQHDLSLLHDSHAFIGHEIVVFSTEMIVPLSQDYNHRPRSHLQLCFSSIWITIVALQHVTSNTHSFWSGVRPNCVAVWHMQNHQSELIALNQMKFLLHF